MVELLLGSFLSSPAPPRSCLAPHFSYEAAAAPGWLVGDASLPRLARVNLRVALGGDKPPPAAPDHAAFWGTEGMSVLSRAEEEEARESLGWQQPRRNLAGFLPHACCSPSLSFIPLRAAAEEHVSRLRGGTSSSCAKSVNFLLDLKPSWAKSTPGGPRLGNRRQPGLSLGN